MNGRIEADPRRYMRVAAWLRCQINDGTLRPGDAAPSINDIAARHGYCRDTCAKGPAFTRAGRHPVPRAGPRLLRRRSARPVRLTGVATRGMSRRVIVSFSCPRQRWRGARTRNGCAGAWVDFGEVISGPSRQNSIGATARSRITGSQNSQMLAFRPALLDAFSVRQYALNIAHQIVSGRLPCDDQDGRLSRGRGGSRGSRRGPRT